MELIERYALKELSAVEIQRAEKHVAKCPVCEERLQEQVDSWAAKALLETLKQEKLVLDWRKRQTTRADGAVHD